MGVTMEQIAAAAGVSLAVVSQTLRHHPNAQRFRPETRRRVWEAAEQLDYRPNFFASQIRKENRRMIMLGTVNLGDSFSGSIASAFSRAAAGRGYAVLNAPLEGGETPIYQQALGSHGILALAVIGYSSALGLPDDRLAELIQAGVRIVAVGREVAVPGVSQVTYDNDTAVHQVVDYLVGQGARRYWIVGTGQARPPAWDITAARVRLTQAALRDHVPAADVTVVSMAGYEPGAAGACEALGDLLRRHGPPEALICTSDSLAWGSLRALSAAGCRIGEDVAVVGFNDMSMSAFANPPLTTVRLPRATMGRLAANLLIDVYEDKETPGRKLTVETELIVRESGCLRR